MGHTDAMGVLRNLGPTSDVVSENLLRLRTSRRLSLRALSESLGDGPGKLTHAAIGEIERGARRIDVDELTALAAALGVSPITLLMPFEGDSINRDASLTGASIELPQDTLRWLRGDAPFDLEYGDGLDSFEAQAFRRRSLPHWAWDWCLPTDRYSSEPSPTRQAPAEEGEPSPQDLEGIIPEWTKHPPGLHKKVPRG